MALKEHFQYTTYDNRQNLLLLAIKQGLKNRFNNFVSTDLPKDKTTLFLYSITNLQLSHFFNSFITSN